MDWELCGMIVGHRTVHYASPPKWSADQYSRPPCPLCHEGRICPRWLVWVGERGRSGPAQVFAHLFQWVHTTGVIEVTSIFGRLYWARCLGVR